MPEVSVLMGTYNEKSKRQTAQAIDSILGQTLTDFEFLICDDGSHEAFYQWLKSYCRKDARIRLLRNEKNSGLAVVMNRCLRYAQGVYIARMDADDVAEKERLRKQAQFLREHIEFAFVGCSAQMIDCQGAWGVRRMEECPQKQSFLHTSPFIHPSVMMRRKVLEAAGGYEESPDVLRTEDYELFMRLYAGGWRGYNMPETLLRYREDRQAYARRRYCYRINECRVRWNGFRQLDILEGNLRFVLKPLAAGLVPARLMQRIHQKRFAAEK